MPMIPMYQPQGDSIGQLLLRQGDIAARGAERSGQIWGGLTQQLGQIGGQALQNYQEQKSAQKRATMLDEVMTGWDGQDPNRLVMRLTHVVGPEAALKYAGAAIGLRNQIEAARQKAEPKLDDWKASLHGFATALRDPKLGIPYVQARWNTFAPALAAGTQKFGGVEIPGQFDDGVAQHLLGMDATFNPPPKKEQTPADIEAEAAARARGTASVKPPEKTLAEIEAESAARARGTASVRPPATPAEKAPIKVDRFNPDTGEMETTFITPAQALAIAEGKADSIGKGPSITERNRMGAARNSLELGNKLLDELGTKEFSSAIGPLIGRYNSLAAAAGAGDPTAQYLVGELKGLSALQPQIHGFRAVRFAEDINKLLNTKQTPEALVAGIKGILEASYVVGRKSKAEDESGKIKMEGGWIRERK